MDVGVVVPCFNEELRWDSPYWSELVAAVPAHFLFVDDGSTDATLQRIQALSGIDKSSVLRLPVNRGKSEAVRLGLLHLMKNPSIVTAGYLDADGAFRATDVNRLLERFDELKQLRSLDALWASRVALAGRDIERSGSRHYIGRAIATFVSLGYGNIPYDTQAGYKLFEVSQELLDCLSQPFKTRWLFEVELLARWKAIKGRPMCVWEEPLNYWHDVKGSKIRGVESLRILRELLQVKREQHQFGRRSWVST